MRDGSSHRTADCTRASRGVARRLLAAIAIALALLAHGVGAGAADALPARIAEAGLPFIHNFSSDQYGGSPQNWAVTQGRDGVIYVGNVSDGVLAFDGARWQRIPVPNQFVVRSLETAPDGRTYVGTVGDFGYLAPDASGQLVYASLLDKVPADARNFSDVWTIHASATDVYFSTLTRVFRLHAGKISVINPETSFHLSFLVNGTFYIRETGRGLMRLAGDKLQLIPGGARFADERIYAILPWHGEGARPGDLLLGTRTQGWFIDRGGDIRPWRTDADAAINEGMLYGAIWLADGRLAAATLRGGVFVLDTHGRLLRRLTRASGLATDVVFAIHQDRQHGLWLATSDGIARVDVDSAITHFGERAGLKGAVLDIARHDRALYVGTTEGLFRLARDDAAGASAHFEQLPGSPGLNWKFLSVDDQLLVAAIDGVFSIGRDGQTHPLLDTGDPQRMASAQVMMRSRQDPSRVFVAHQDGVGTLRWTGGRWVDEGRVRALPMQVTSFMQDAAGDIWMGLWRGGIDRLTLPPDWQGPGDPRALKIESFGAGDGLPGGQQEVVKIGGELRLLTHEGVYRFNAATRRFAVDPMFRDLFPGGPRQVATLREAHDGALWMYTTNVRGDIKETGRAVHKDGHWQWQVTPLQALTGIGMTRFFDDPDGIAWLGGERGLFRFDPSRQPADDAGFSALIREVQTHAGRVLPLGPANARMPAVPYEQNALRFEFAAPSYDTFEANRFQVLLQGVDRGWSPWGGDAFRDYTNIHEGAYRFHVRARNVYGDDSKVATFDFRVLPPWYRSWWAWSIWIVSGALLIALLVRWRSAALRRRNRELAALVDERTGQLADANAALQSSNARLAEQSVTDPLTGLKNRRFLYDHIEQDLAIARRHCHDRRHGAGGLPHHSHILFLMLDVDHFKEVNDTYGHAAGDRLLVQLRDILLAGVRDADIPVRWGGEEFLIVARFTLPDAGPQFAERIRTAVAGHRFDLGEGRCVRRTCSIGFASYPACGDDPDRLSWEQVVNMADECMYAAKGNGRNAWAGVLPLAMAPEGGITDALRTTLARLPEPGPLPVAASWLDEATASPVAT